jgi:phenylalanyl-tRNA synthetase beta chain
MQAWGGGTIAQGLLDNYPNPPVASRVTITTSWVNDNLGTNLETQDIVEILHRLEFTCEVNGQWITAKAPDHRMDINDGIVGRADLLEEISRIYGYDKIPSQRLDQPLPPQQVDQEKMMEETLRDLLVNLGLQELNAYRMTSPERELRRFPADYEAPKAEYIEIRNPISVERRVMRRSILATLLEILEYNSNLSPRLALFEIGPVFLPLDNQQLPEEKIMLSIGITGQRNLSSWQGDKSEVMDFYDLKGIFEGMVQGLHIEDVHYRPGEHPSLHPGKTAEILIGDTVVGMMGELHPLVKANYELGEPPVYVAELDLAPILAESGILFDVEPAPTYPPVLEDLAVVVDETIPAAAIEDVLRKGGGEYLTKIRLFDIYRGKQVGEGKKSLAFSLTYMAPDRTLTDKEVQKLRNSIVYLLDQELGASLRS